MEKKKDRNLIRFDWALKRLLRNKANFDVLEGFLSVVIGKEIVIDHIGESEGNKSSPKIKHNRVDIYASIKKENDDETMDKIFIIELQVASETEYFHRMLFGVSKAISESIDEGDKYDKIKKVYHIDIAYFELGQGEDYVYHGWTDFHGIHVNDVLKLSKNQKERYLNINDMPKEADVKASYIFPEYYVLRVNDFDDIARDSLDEWIYYLKHDAIPEEFTAPGLDIVREKLLYEQLSVEEQQEYNYYKTQARDDESTITTAHDEGFIEGRDEMQGVIDEKNKVIEEKDKALEESKKEIEELKRLLNKQN